MPGQCYPAGARSRARTTLGAGAAAHVLRLLCLHPAGQTFAGLGKVSWDNFLILVFPIVCFVYVGYYVLYF